MDEDISIINNETRKEKIINVIENRVNINDFLLLIKNFFTLSLLVLELIIDISSSILNHIP